MTPSEAHDSAYGRTPEHDQMVVDIYELLQTNAKALPYHPVFTTGYGEVKDSHEYDSGEIECERMYSGHGSTFFADLAVLRWSDHAEDAKSKPKRFSHHLILEMKPKIYSAGAVLRQVKAQKAQADRWIESDKAAHEWFRQEAWATVAPVFTRGDPLIGLFARMAEESQVYFIWDAADGILHKGRTATILKAAA